MAYVRKIKAALVKQEFEEYVGEYSYIFYDIETGCMRIWDGTPGGKPICDGAVGPIGDILLELQYIRDFIGKDLEGIEDPSYSSTIVITQNASLEQAISELDAVNAPNPLEQGTVLIAPGATETVISYAPLLNSASKYIVAALNTVNGEYAVSEVLGTYKATDDSVVHTQFNKMGDKVLHTPNLTYSSPNIEFVVTNNDVNPISVSVTRIPTLSV